MLEHRIRPLWESRPVEFPLAGEVLDLATGLIVHSRYVEGRARQAGYTGPIWRIPHPAWPDPEVEPLPVEGDPLFGCFGHLNETKRILPLLKAFERARTGRPGARLLLVGAVPARLQRLDLPGGVIREEYVPEARLWALMTACDVCISLRAPTMGETSGSTIRALTLGKPLVVSDVGWFSELPDEVALKVPVDEREVETLVAALELLASDAGARVAMGEAAVRLAEGDHRLDRVADAYAAVLEEAAAAVSAAAGPVRAAA